VFSLPSPWVVALPALSDCCLDSLRLTQVALACGMRSSQDAGQDSYPTADVRRNYVDTTVPQLIADLCSGLLIEVSVELVATATVDGRRMLGDLLIAFACKGRP